MCVCVCVRVFAILFRRVEWPNATMLHEEGNQRYGTKLDIQMSLANVTFLTASTNIQPGVKPATLPQMKCMTHYRKGYRPTRQPHQP